VSTANDLWGRYKDYTSDLTEFARKLGFAAAGICWVLKQPNDYLPPAILSALGALTGFFLLDITQRLWAAMRLKRFIELREAEFFRSNKQAMPANHEVEVPRALDAPIFRVFVVKIVFLMGAFALIGVEILSRGLR
jgi:hypothetical protein